MQVISTSRCGPVCLSAWLSVASAFFATLRTEVTRYLSRCESARSVIVSADFDPKQPSKEANAFSG